MTDKTAALHDLRTMCTHEAGHVAVARSLGATLSYCQIWPTPTPDAFARQFAGRSHILGGPALTPKARRAIGLAGVVAEALLENPAADVFHVVDVLAMTEPSESDLAFAGLSHINDCEERELARIVEKVRRLWPAISREAAQYASRFESMEEVMTDDEPMERDAPSDAGSGEEESAWSGLLGGWCRGVGWTPWNRRDPGGTRTRTIRLGRRPQKPDGASSADD